MLPLLACIALALPLSDPDTDRDGLPDFLETHKYGTDPTRADSDGDGRPDGDWAERREFAYTVRCVMDLLLPCDVDAMTDDWQDARLVSKVEGGADDHVRVEVVVYPLATVLADLRDDPDWRKAAGGLQQFVTPSTTSDWDAAMKAALEEELAKRGVDAKTAGDAALAREAAAWLLKRGTFEDGFTTFSARFRGGRPELVPECRDDVEKQLARLGRTLDEQWRRELFGRGMFETKSYGTCTSTAIYLQTGLRALGLPARTIYCVPPVDASDPAERAFPAALHHEGMRAVLEESVGRLQENWASHTLNEVFVGGRWRRLNYSKLGQGALDPGGLGLLIHANTWRDQADAELWRIGRRQARAGEAGDVCGHRNPYSCVELDDAIGEHARLEPWTKDFATLTIERVARYADAEVGGIVKMRLDDPETAGHFVFHVAEGGPFDDMAKFDRFWRTAGKEFRLVADGHPTLRAHATRGFWIDLERDVKEFYLRVDPAEFARMDPGVAYALGAKPDGDAMPWHVVPGVTVTR